MGGLPALAAAQAVEAAASRRRVNFVMVWTGEKYSRDYPAVLHNMLARNASALEDDCAFWAITDRPDELPPGVYPIPADPRYPGWWAKCQLFSRDLPWQAGDRCVYFDLDVAITGRLEDLVEREGIIRDWHWPCANSSVMVWTHGDHAEIWDTLTPERITRPAGPDLAPLLPKGEINGGDQEHITEIGGWDFFPSDWFRSYRDCHAWPPNECKAVIFHGATKPHQITDGWVPNVWTLNGFTSLPEFKGVNTSEDARLEHVRINSQRDLDWFTGFRDEGRTCVIACGAPSMRNHIGEIRAHKRRGARIISVNNAWRWLHQNGVTPDVNVMLDARPDNAAFLDGMPKSMRLLLASQCHPSVFDKAQEQGLDVVLWHNGYDTGNDKLREILDPWWAGPGAKPCILVPGGSTVGLRSLWLATYSGFRTIHLYGIDSSYADTGEHHAYAQPLNDGETVLDVVMGEKRYRCAPWMARQAAEFQQTWRDLREYEDEPGNPAPVTIHTHGTGLIPDIAKRLRAEERAAA